MNPYIRKSIFFLFYLFTFININAQDRIRQIPCYDEYAKNQLDSLKASLSYQGFTLLREASMVMENDYEMPVIAPFIKDSWYQIIFIGDRTARLFEVRMFDYSEKQVIYKKQGIENNVISYSYIPQSSEYYVIKPLQVGKRKKKNFCGYIVLFKKEG